MDFDLYAIAQILCDKTFRLRVPYTPQSGNINGHYKRASTGNLRNTATYVIKTSENEVQIFVDSAIAPYVVYTNEPWVSPKWKGKQNPNEKWFERAVEMVAQELAAMLGGTLSTEEV